MKVNLMKRFNRVSILAIIILIAAGIIGFIFFKLKNEQAQIILQTQAPVTPPSASKPKYKVLYIMSYHSDWSWTQEQFDGFKYPLQNLDIEYKVFEMDTKRNSSTAWKEQVGAKARELIDAWNPDLVYVSDDDGQEYVTKYYINKDTPFVFSAVNANPAQYGFEGSQNITGVLERPHYAQSVQLLQRIKPDIQTIAVVIDDSPMWDSVVQTMKDETAQLNNVEIVRWDTIRTFEEYKQRIREYQTTVDAIALIGIFGFKDEEGFNVPYQNVLRWTTENSNLPDFSFWDDRISYGTLCTVTVSGYEQGLAAGKIARGILVENRSPASYPMQQTIKGKPYISLARANKLGLTIDSDILLTSQIVQSFKWEE